MGIGALWFMVPAKAKLYGLIIIVVLLAFLRYRNNVMVEAVTKYALEVANADEKRAAEIRAAGRAARLDGVHRSDDRGFRD